MAPPTNISFLTATSLGTTLPNTVTQRVDDAGTTYEVYYSYTAKAGDPPELGVWAFGDLVTYKPTMTVFTGSAGAPTSYMTGFAALNVPIQMPVTVGANYFFKITPNAGNPTPANLTLNIQKFPNQASAPRGSIVINDSTEAFGSQQFPMVVLNQTTGAPIQFITDNPSQTEWAAVWRDGTVAMLMDSSSDGTRVHIYNGGSGTLTLRTTVTDPLGGMTLLNSLCSDMSTRFYVGGIANTKVVALDGTGATIQSWTVSAAPFNLGVDQANAILYFTVAGNSAIHRHNLATDTGLTNLVAAVANYSPQTNPILGLADGTLLVPYLHSGAAPEDFFVRHYDATGATLNTYNFGNVGIDPRIAMALDDPVSFWVWTKGYAGAGTLGTDTIRNIKVSDGSTIISFTTQQYVEGVFRGTATATPTRYGHDESCAFSIMFAPTPVSTFTVVPRVIRRLRRAPHIAQLGQRIYINRFLLDMQTGVGANDVPTTPGHDPTVMLRFSKNGGLTFSDEIEMSAGELGRYFKRVYVWRLGQARDWVFEVTVSDPVSWSLMAAVLDLEPGTN